MTFARWPFCVVVLSASLMVSAGDSSQVASVDDETVEWVQTSDDSVVEAGLLDEMQSTSTDGGETSNGLFDAVTLGDGFNVFGLRSYGDYTIRLLTTGDGNIENYRIELQQTANEINAYNGTSIVVAPGTISGPADHNNPTPPAGEIWVMVSLVSPCGNLSGGFLGCGGIRGSAVIDGISRWSSGAVWLSPTLPGSCEQPVVSHEVGHAMGLDHFNTLYLGQTQIMASSTNCVSPVNFQAGDLNGLRWLSEPPPSNDTIANAALVCPGDSTVSADTWFATKEPGEFAHSGAGPRRSVWYRYMPRPEQNGLEAIIKTVNDGVDDFDTVLDVFRGASYPSAPVTNDNDSGPGTLSQVSFTIDSSENYWIIVDGVGFGRGETDVMFDLPPVDGDLVPLCSPARMLDTRFGGTTFDGAHQAVGKIAAGGTYTLPIAGRASIPGTADSVVLNVTAIQPNANGFVTVYPCGEIRPTTSNLNFTAGDVIPNMVVARVGAAQSVCFYSSVLIDLLVDVSAYFPASDALVPLATPGRLLDTRTGGQTVDDEHEGVGVIPANGTYELPVVDRAGVDAGADSVVLNVTAVHPLTKGFITVYPCGAPKPNASSLNFAPGDVIPNAVIATVGVDGKVCFFSSATTDLLVDVSGYFPATDVLTPLAAPKRFLDTRLGGTTVDGQHQSVGVISAGVTYELPVAGRSGVPANVVAVVLNVSALQPNATGFVTVFACGQDRPNSSNLNFRAGDVIPNAVIASVGTGGKVCIYSSATTDLLVDVSGYFP